MVSLTCYNLYFGSPSIYSNQKEIFLYNLNPQDMDDGKEDVRILDLAASEVSYNFIGLFDD